MMEYIYGQTLKRGTFTTRWPVWGRMGRMRVATVVCVCVCILSVGTAGALGCGEWQPAHLVSSILPLT